MQQFLLFYTMLIVASEAFSQELHGSQISRSIRRRTSRLANKLIPPSRDRYMFRRLSFPLFSPPPVYYSPDYEEPSVVPPVRRKGFHPPKRRKNRRFSSRKRSRRKYSKRRGWSPLDVDPGRGYESVWPSPPDPRPNFTDLLEPRLMARNPNTQYIVYLYPVFIRPRKRRVVPLKKVRFVNSRRQYWTSLRNKNKRSAGNVTREVSLEETPPKTNESTTTVGDDGYVPKTSLEPPPLDLLSGKSGNGVSENNKNVDAHREPDTFRYDDFQKYQRDYFDLYNPYFDVTRPQVTQPTVTLPTITFRYPYDRRLYEPSFRREDRYQAEELKKEKLVEDRFKKQINLSSHQDFSKLKEMLREVECMLGAGSNCDKDMDYKSDDEGKKEKSEKSEGVTESVEKFNDTISLKQKIDCIAIPILTQISERLGNMTNMTSSSSSSSSSSSLSGTGTGTGNNSSNSSNSSVSKLAAVAQHWNEVDGWKLYHLKEHEKQYHYAKAQLSSADGTWKSSAYGVEFNFRTLPNLMLKVKVPSNGKSVINHKWSVQGLTLSKRGGPLMLAAIYPQKRKIASFIGQCKTCQDQDLIFGSWTVFSCARKFTDLWSAVETKLDILKKVKVGTKNSSDRDKKSKKSQKRTKSFFKFKTSNVQR